MRELKPDLAHALSPGGPALAGADGVDEVWPLWRHAASQRVRDLAWCSLAPPLLSRLPARQGATHSAAHSAAHDVTQSATLDTAQDDATHSAARGTTRDAAQSATHGGTRSAAHEASHSAAHSATYDTTHRATHDATHSAAHSAVQSTTHDATHSVTQSATLDPTHDATHSAAHDVVQARASGGPLGSAIDGGHDSGPDGPRAFGLAHWPAASRAAWVRWLAAADPDTLPETIAELADQRGAGKGARAANRSLRLGRHAERLLQFALSHAPGLELLAANVPVRHRHEHGIRTLGELDFVWRDPVRDEVVHWEMATKFYLHVGVPAGWTTGDVAAGLRAFVGPNLVDRLGDKLDHIVRRQLPLGHTAEARAALGRGIDRGEVYLLGWLFYRDGVLPPGLDALGIAPDHLRGWWSTLDDWAARAAARPASRWCRLSRADWLSAMRIDETARADDPVFEDVPALRAALATRFDDPDPEQSWRREAPVMLCELAPAGPHGQAGWIEISRGFVVPEGWEARAVERVGRP